MTQHKSKPQLILALCMDQVEHNHLEDKALMLKSNGWLTTVPILYLDVAGGEA